MAKKTTELERAQGTTQREVLWRLLAKTKDAASYATDPSWGNQLACPICGFEFVHLESVSHSETDNYDAWTGKESKGAGGAVRVFFRCENGHKWVLRFGFHKGQTYVAIEDMQDDSEMDE